MNCPQCGARNTAEAPWCTQCLEPLTTPPPPEPTTPEARVSGERVPVAGMPGSSPSGDTPAADGANQPTGDVDRPFRTVDGEVEWRCPSCDTWNLLAIPSCSVCGRALASSGREGDRLADRVARARRPLWALAIIGAVVMIGSVVLLLLALRGGAGV